MSPQPPPRPNPKQENVNRSTYIPEHVKVQMEKQMQRNLPGHLKQYAGAYMQQHVYDPSMNGGASRPMQSGAPPPSYHPVTHLPRESHYVQYEGDSTQADGQPPQEQPNSNFSPEQAYDFINDPAPSPSRRSMFLSNSSLPARIAIFGGALVVVLILFVVIKGFFGGGSATPGYVTVAQDQQELLHLIKSTESQQDLSTANSNFVATASLSLGTSQTDLITYLSKNGKKVKTKELDFKISKSTDAQLASSVAAANYNQTFKEIMKTKLNAYMRDLQQTYQESTGENGRALLSNQYDQAKLLLVQLDDTNS